MAAIHVTCPACSAALRLAQEVPAGKRIKCPKCGETFAPVEAALQETAPIAAAPRRAERAAPPDDPEPRRPRRSGSKRSKQKSNTALVVGVIVAAVLLLGAAVSVGAVLWLKPTKKEEPFVAAATVPRTPAVTNPVPRINPGGGSPVSTAPSRPPVQPSVPSLPAYTPSGKAGLEIGDLALEIDAEDIDGKRFKLSDYRGKVVVLDFWGHW